MERAQWNTTVTAPKGILAVGKGELFREWMLDRKGYAREVPRPEPALFNVEFLHDAVWDGETEWEKRPAGKTYDRGTWRPEPAFFNVELLHDALWKV